MADPNWAEQVTAVATAVGAVGLVSTLGLVEKVRRRHVSLTPESRQATEIAQ